MKLEHSAIAIAALALAFAGWCALETHRLAGDVDWLSGQLRATQDQAASAMPPAAETASGSGQSGAVKLPQIMTGIQTEFGKLYFAGKDGNWPLAQYEADKIANDLADVPVVRPQENGVPLGAVIQAFENSQWPPLTNAIGQQDFAAFDSAYTNVVFICNACHQATGRPFIHIIVPTQPPVANQLFSPAPPVVSGPMMQ